MNCDNAPFYVAIITGLILLTYLLKTCITKIVLDISQPAQAKPADLARRLVVEFGAAERGAEGGEVEGRH